MLIRTLKILSILSLAPAFAAAQGAAYPPGVIARGVALALGCRGVGGQPVNGSKPFVVTQHDLTGDGRRDFILDESAFGCTSDRFSPLTADGAPIEIFDGSTGQSLYRGVAAGWRVTPGPRPQVTLTLLGGACAPNALATTTCQRPLVWNAQTRTLVGPSAPPPPTQPPAAAQPAATGPGSLAVSDADRAAAFRAAGFKLVGRDWKRCEEDPSPSYSPGTVEEIVDLNADGRPELVIREGSTFCHGQQGDWFAILSKEPNGAWRQVLETDGVFVAMPTKANGWQEVMVGGPGFTHPAYRYNGRQYVHNRMVRE